jgi:hypothetical protein
MALRGFLTGHPDTRGKCGGGARSDVGPRWVHGQMIVRYGEPVFRGASHPVLDLVPLDVSITQATTRIHDHMRDRS